MGAAQESDKYSCVVKKNISSMQRGVAQSFTDSSSQAPLVKGVAEDKRSRILRLLASHEHVDAKREPSNLVLEDVDEALGVELEMDDLINEQVVATAA